VAYNGPIALFKAGEHFDVAEDLGWRELAAGGLLVQTVPGDHHTMVRQPNVRALAEGLDQQLEMFDR
jgi:thioesterase domain-containing protein